MKLIQNKDDDGKHDTHLTDIGNHYRMEVKFCGKHENI